MRLNKKLPGLPDWPDIERHKNEYVVDALIVPYGRYFTATMLFPIAPKLLCEMFFQTRVTIRFNRSQIIVGKDIYEADSGVNIQFRAIRPHMSGDDYRGISDHVAAGRLGQNAARRLKYRRVEMIY